jgi:hypothetical protein
MSLKVVAILGRFVQLTVSGTELGVPNINDTLFVMCHDLYAPRAERKKQEPTLSVTRISLDVLVT